MSLKLEVVDPNSNRGFIEEYKKLTQNSPMTTPFHTIPWLEVLKDWIPDSHLLFLSLEDGGETLGAMPIIKKRIGPFTFAYSLPYGTYGGFISKEKIGGISQWDKYLLPKGGMSQLVDIWNTLAPSPIFETRREVCHMIELPGSYEELFENIYNRTQRKSLRASRRLGLIARTLETENALRIFYEHYKVLYHRKGSSVLPFDKLKRAMEILKRAGLWRGFLVLLNGKILGGIISLYHPQMTVAYISGYQYDARKYKVMNFLIDAAIRDAIQLGSKIFNLGTTPRFDRGVIQFKESFGARPHFYSVHIKTSRLYSLWKRLKRP